VSRLNTLQTMLTACKIMTRYTNRVTILNFAKIIFEALCNSTDAAENVVYKQTSPQLDEHEERVHFKGIKPF